MPRIDRKVASPAAQTVNAARPATSAPAAPHVVHNADGTRTLTLHLPAFKTWTEEEIAAAESAEGKRIVAICDFTGEPIFKTKNANEITSEREELDAKIISTRLLKILLLLAENNAAPERTEED